MLTLLQLHMELLLNAMRSFRNLNFLLNRYRVSEFLTAASGLGHKSFAYGTNKKIQAANNTPRTVREHKKFSLIPLLALWNIPLDKIIADADGRCLDTAEARIDNRKRVLRIQK